MISLAIVEDEKIYADKLIEYINQYKKESGHEIKVTWFQDGYDIVEDYQSEFDIIFLDIQMKFMDGMTAAKKIREKDDNVILMFVTNMTNYAIRGYEVSALDYIVKPVKYFAFSQKLERAIKKIKNNQQRFLSIPVEKGVWKINIEEIMYIESQGHNLVYKTKEKEIVSRGVLKEAEKLLISYGFFRNSKSFLVNMKYVEGVKENYCVVNGNLLPISRSYKKDFMKTLLEYMSEVV